MKRYLHAFAMCQSMFCSIPCPWHVWDEEAKDKMLLFFPLVGLEIGLIWTLLGWLCVQLQLPMLVRGIILCAYPFLVTGYIHLDGFMDVTDAVRSYRDLEKRRAILKDSLVGAFSVIGCILLMLTQFAVCASLDGDFGIMMLIPVVTRCCSPLAIALLRPMSTSQYNAQKACGGYIAALVLMLLAALAAGFVLFGRFGFALLGVLAGFLLALRRGYRSLEGMNGDISGYALTMGELCGLVMMALL